MQLKVIFIVLLDNVFTLKIGLLEREMSFSDSQAHKMRTFTFWCH